MATLTCRSSTVCQTHSCTVSSATSTRQEFQLPDTSSLLRHVSCHSNALRRSFAYGRIRVDRSGRVRVVCDAQADESIGNASQVAVSDRTALEDKLRTAITTADSEAVKGALDVLKEAGYTKLWRSYSNVSRRTTFMRELSQIGLKNPETLAIPSVRNDAAFLIAVVGTTSFFAVIAGFLPGDWGFFVPYLIGSISLVVLAVGSVAPGLLTAATDLFSQGFADTKQRVLRHEAAHFLLSYLLGLPIVGYSLDIGKEHINLIDEKLQKKLYQGSLESSELDRLAVVSMAGLAAEGLFYDKVIGQSADLFTLQRLINRTKPALSNDQQQNLTRWAVVYAASLLKSNNVAYEALQEAMAAKASVADCILAVETAK